MGRRMFLRHLAEVNAPGTIPDMQHIHTAEEGVVSCRFTYSRTEDEAPASVNIQLCAIDVDEYPEGNSFMIYTDDEAITGLIPLTLQRLSQRAQGRQLPDLLRDVSETLTASINGTLDIPSPSQVAYEADEFEEPDLDFEDGWDVDFGLRSTSEPQALSLRPTSTATTVDLGMIRADLTAVRNAGFRVGVLGNLQTSGILCISIRTVKLGLSEEAMQAWNLQRKHYLVLLIRYPHGYRDIHQVKEDITLGSATEMRVSLCDHYKPQLRDVLNSFQSTKEDVSPDQEQARPDLEKARESSAFHSKIESLFIDKPLNQLLHDFLPQIIKARLAYGLTWLGAEKFIQARQVCATADSMGDMSAYMCDDTAGNTAHPPVVMANHMTDTSVNELSLPLVAMQFVLRHFTRCTEFCLVCHCRIDDTFEALKPYVCSRPLCLYQYMSLGFGPRIEWEIDTQPYVVDLLISFCYIAASNGSLKVLPVGMSFAVPVLPSYANPFPPSGGNHPSVYKPTTVTPPAAIEESFCCQWDLTRNEMSIDQDKFRTFGKLKVGCWVALVRQASKQVAHCRVEKISLPYITLSKPIMVDVDTSVDSLVQYTWAGSIATSMANTQNPSKTTEEDHGAAKCYIYEHNFDDLPSAHQHHAIATLLGTLPSVNDMRQYLDGRDQNSLGNWKSRISDSALAILRWIIASNTSCIMQVDQIDKNGTFLTADSSEDRVGRMNQWIQFRFAQGAPDKEQRFLDCVSQEATPSAKYPTLFAWHGSSLRNWHSIIRQGLRFDDIINGRAFGNGVYMSRDATTSLGYSGHRGGRGTEGGWKQSKLQITNAFSLNEVVNRPEKFVSTKPHYVVANIDWIQTRYLFVKSMTPASFSGSPSVVYEQDPNLHVFNEQQNAIEIPISAISKSRRPATMLPSNEDRRNKRNKSTVETDQATAERLEDDANSVISDLDDLELLAPIVANECEGAFEDMNRMSSGSQSSASRSRKRPVEEIDDTDFVPGTLDVSGIKFLDPPKDATPSATKALMRSFRESLAVQEETSLSKLGWYIDSNLVNNMYQWIVELHSFPSHLPLSKDMKAANLTSIVLEIRFSPNYPFTPPFIRVVKPRFLPFGQGGGGNVTEGGAMCMEALTNNGWTAAQTIDALLLQVRMAICDEERPARLGNKGHGSGRGTYAIGEAVQAYIRACRNHGWTVPEGFEKLGVE